MRATWTPTLHREAFDRALQPSRQLSRIDGILAGLAHRLVGFLDHLRDLLDTLGDLGRRDPLLVCRVYRIARALQNLVREALINSPSS